MRSILFEKIDFVEQNQGFVHKMFGNGNVVVFTKGSGSSDMSLKDISDHTQIYKCIKEKIDEREEKLK